MQIRCSKKGCKKHEKCSKMEPKWEPKSRKSLSKTRSENRCEKRGECPDPPGGSAVCGGHPLKTNNLVSSRFSSRIASRDVLSRFEEWSVLSNSPLASCISCVFARSMYKCRQKCHVNGSSETSEVQMPKIPLPGAERSIAKATEASHIVLASRRM